MARVWFWLWTMLVVRLIPVRVVARVDNRRSKPGSRRKPGRRLGTFILLAVAALPCGTARAAEPADWKVGLATVKITPERPVPLFGYGNRESHFDSVDQDLFAKALALEDTAGRRAVIVTLDLVGFQAANSEDLLRRIEQRSGLAREALLVNASHTHTGPLVSLHPAANGNLSYANLSGEEVKNTLAYTHELHDKLVDLVAQSLANLEPARLSWGQGKISFPTNRRVIQKDGSLTMAANPDGVTDRTVPVLRIDAPDGKLRGVLFGCACHNVALGVQNVVSGDYAGAAQAELERRYPGAIALFMAGCGANANPEPWGSLQHGVDHGNNLAAEVARVLDEPLAAVRGPLGLQFRMVDLPLQALARGDVERYASQTTSQGWPTSQSLMGKHMLEVLDGGETLLTSYTAPLAVWQFGQDLTLVALPAEPVAEYVQLLQQVLGPEKLWVAGFNNDCFGYLPTAQIIAEGGHEAIGITVWNWGEDLFRQTGFFEPGVEQVVIDGVRQLAVKAGRAPLP